MGALVPGELNLSPTLPSKAVLPITPPLPATQEDTGHTPVCTPGGHTCWAHLEDSPPSALLEDTPPSLHLEDSPPSLHTWMPPSLDTGPSGAWILTSSCHHGEEETPVALPPVGSVARPSRRQEY